MGAGPPPAWLPGIALTVAALLSPVALWATRRLMDRLSHGRALAGGAVLLGLLALAMAWLDSAPLTAAAYLAWTAANGILLGRWQALTADAAPEAERPRWFAVQGSSWGIAQPAVPGVVALAGAVAGGLGAAAFLTAGLAFLLVPLALRDQSP
ncbi:hypothetical protein [Nonomuraea solani]|uniref:hypothetical protein n=1 Tax=Nonomuraea solani TaxID=1144553 RepID=UPI000CDE6006|nr:hypothetical protein [Nonomuraea solani]